MPKIISPELLRVLVEMGHSDRILIAAGKFLAENVGKNAAYRNKLDGCV